MDATFANIPGWQIACACAVVMLLLIAYFAWRLWRACTHNAGISGSRGLLADLDAATALVDVHLDALATHADTTADSVAQLEPAMGRVSTALSELKHDVDSLTWLLRAPARLRWQLVERLAGILLRP